MAKLTKAQFAQLEYLATFKSGLDWFDDDRITIPQAQKLVKLGFVDRDDGDDPDRNFARYRYKVNREGRKLLDDAQGGTNG